MANHKRGKPKSSRAGCLLCKPHKRQGTAHKFRNPVSAMKGILAHAVDGASMRTLVSNNNAFPDDENYYDVEQTEFFEEQGDIDREFRQERTLQGYYTLRDLRSGRYYQRLRGEQVPKLEAAPALVAPMAAFIKKAS